MNDYEVIRQIGQGAFGKAFLVKDKGGGGNTQCVVKEISLRKVQQHSSVSLPAVLPGIRKRSHYIPLCDLHMHSSSFVVSQLCNVCFKHKLSLSDIQVPASFVVESGYGKTTHILQSVQSKTSLK